MTLFDFKLRGKCHACGKQRWFVRGRVVKLPFGGLTARSKDLYICTPCYTKLQESIDQNSHG